MQGLRRTGNKAATAVAFTFLFFSPCVAPAAWGQQIDSQGQTAPTASTSVAPVAASAPVLPKPVEHWDVLPLAGSGLHAFPPVPGEKDNLPSFTRELLSVQWRANDPIDLYVIRPKGVAKPPVVLFLYGFPTDADKFRSDALCQNIVRHGFAAVGFVSALTGQRYHDRPMKEWFVSELQESLGTSVHDVQMVLDYLATRNDLDLGRVGIFGQGSGGAIAILAATVEPRLKAVDVMDPWGDWPDWLAKSPQIPEHERADYLKPVFLVGVAPLDPVRVLGELKGRPFRIQENLFNQAMPDTVRRQIETAAAGAAQIVEYHNVEEYEKRVSAEGRMLDWLQIRLSDTAAPQMTAKEFLQKAVEAERKAGQQP